MKDEMKNGNKGVVMTEGQLDEVAGGIYKNMDPTAAKKKCKRCTRELYPWQLVAGYCEDCARELGKESIGML